MGRILDLCTEIAESAEEGEDNLVLPADVWQRLRAEWSEEDIEDAMNLVHENILQSELVERADSLNARLLDLLGTYGSADGFRDLEGGRAALTVDVAGQLARRVARLEEVLDACRDSSAPDRGGFDQLQQRLADHGIETEMSEERVATDGLEGGGREEEEEEEEETR
jgi:hypothetical protein